MLAWFKNKYFHVCQDLESLNLTTIKRGLYRDPFKIELPQGWDNILSYLDP